MITETWRYPLERWAPAHYLKRMAASADGAVRAKVVGGAAGAENRRGFRAAGHHVSRSPPFLPSAEAALLSDVAVEWLKPRHFWTLKAPEQFLLHLIKGGERDAVLEIARVLFIVTRNEAGVLTRYDRFDYEHSMPPFVEPITKLCGLDALSLYCDLLERAAIASQYVKSEPPGDYTTASAPLADRNKAKHDIYAALAWAVKECAAQLIAEDKALTGAVVDMLMARRLPHLQAIGAGRGGMLAPAELGPRAAALLKDTGLLGQPWCARNMARWRAPPSARLSPKIRPPSWPKSTRRRSGHRTSGKRITSGCTANAMSEEESSATRCCRAAMRYGIGATCCPKRDAMKSNRSVRNMARHTARHDPAFPGKGIAMSARSALRRSSPSPWRNWRHFLKRLEAGRRR